MSGTQNGVVLVVAGLFVIVPILFIITGFVSLFWPRTAWFLSEGWKFKNVEPSGCVLAAIRIGGLVSIAVGCIALAVLWMLSRAQ